MREIKFRAFNRETKEMIPADSWYFSDEFEPFVDSVKNAQRQYEIMQFTGLLDRNGKEIFEGDVVSCFGQTVKIFWEFGSWQIQGGGLLDNLKENCEVIGNIYESKHLLEAK